MKKLFMLLLGLFLVVGLAQAKPITAHPTRCLKVAPIKTDSAATALVQLTRPADVPAELAPVATDYKVSLEVATKMQRSFERAVKTYGGHILGKVDLIIDGEPYGSQYIISVQDLALLYAIGVQSSFEYWQTTDTLSPLHVDPGR